ncbi:MAG: pantothenate kinase [Bacteroidetes bacterium MedPE-SWsnd-G2]|nr:MAG: pantothenate kinase [Bacteroidetes bacterium MedPE-SWsnd-G2]
MNLIIDVGNSLVKIAVFQEGKLKVKDAFKLESFLEFFQTFFEVHGNFDKCIVSSVGKLTDLQLNSIKEKVEVFELNSKTPLPFKNLYSTPNTLGIDRLALVSALVNQYPNTNALVIDAGTCVTFDFLTAQNTYLGGAISPGLRLRYQALNNFTANLPLLETKRPNGLIGNSTSEAIHSGVVLGLVNELEGVISKYQEKYSDLTVILTGGDADFLSKQFKNGIFANSNFLLEGLNYILEFNSN